MADSLRDQLLKSGLVQKLKVETRDARPAAKPARPSGPPPGRKGKDGRPPQARVPRPDGEIDLGRAYAMRDRAERAERDRAQAEAERRAKEKRERRQKLGDLLAGKALNDAAAEIARHFLHGSKIRRVYCTAEQLARVNGGAIGIVQMNGRYLLVEREIALAAQAIDADALVLLCDPDAVAEDDVPADLVW